MASIAISKTAWDGLSEDQVRGLREITSLPFLGDPAEYEDETGQGWVVFDDQRISEEQVAFVAALMENPSAIPLIEEEPSDV